MSKSQSRGLVQVKCPECQKWQSDEDNKACFSCGYALRKHAKGLKFRLDYFEPSGRRRREKVDTDSRADAYHALNKKTVSMYEGRYVEKSPDAETYFKALAEWYLTLPEVKAKRSFNRDVQLLANLLPYFGDKLLKDIAPATVEAYRQKRLAAPSGRTPAKLTAPATVNREVACLKTIFNKGIANERAERSPFQGKKIKMLRENNERDRILTPDEYACLLAHCSPQIRPIIKVAYHTAMRQGEILNLTWGQVDLKEGFIHLGPEDTKTNEGRSIPLYPELMEMLKAMPRGLPGVRVFSYKGRAFGSSFQRAFETARTKAGLEDFTFHDLRHTAINNWRLQGHDYFRIMAASGHKTMNVFKRYTKVDKEELKKLVGRQGVSG